MDFKSNLPHFWLKQNIVFTILYTIILYNIYVYACVFIYYARKQANFPVFWGWGNSLPLTFMTDCSLYKCPLKTAF